MKYKFLLLLMLILACAFNIISCENDNDELWMSLHISENHNTKLINDNENNNILTLIKTADGIAAEDFVIMNENLGSIKKRETFIEKDNEELDDEGSGFLDLNWGNDINNSDIDLTWTEDDEPDLEDINIKNKIQNDDNKINLINFKGINELPLPNIMEDPYNKNSENIVSKIDKEEQLEPKPGQRSLVIVFDGTASMTDDLDQLRAGAEYIVDKLTKREDNPIYNYILVPFRDPEIGPKIVTTNQQKLLDELKNIKISGGGDCPEHALGGIIMALESALPQSFVYVFTDAVAKDFALDDRVIQLVEKKQTPITFFITGFCKSETSPEYLVFQKIAAASNGQIFNLQKRNVKQVITSIESLLDTNRVPVISIDSKEGKNQTIDFDVDKNLKELTVSVAGSKPNITVTNPQNETQNQGENILNLDNIKVVKVDQPEPGKWTIDTSSDSAHSIRLSGVSDVTFSYGFSIGEPKQSTGISYRPLLNTDNVLTIIPSDSELISNLTSTTISLFNDVNSDAEPLDFDLPLKMKIIKDKEVYMTIPFQPPRQFFKIHINGFDSAGNPIKRLLTTVIKSTIQELPDIIVHPDLYEIMEGDSLTLKCQINSFIPIKAEWKKYNFNILKEMEANQSTEFNYSIENADVSDAGKYYCYAINDVGGSTKFITVKVQQKPLTVNTPRKVMNVNEGSENVFLYCDISPQFDVDVMWLFNGQSTMEYVEDSEIDGSNLILNHVDRTSSGTYTCVGEMRNIKKNDTIELIISYPAELIDNQTERISTPYESPVALTCNSDGVPKPRKSWTMTKQNNTVKLGNSETIIFDNFQPDNEGTYYCEIDNGIGSSPIIRTIYLEGEAIEQPKIHKTNHSVIITNVGDDLELKCKCYDCMPILQYSWLFGSRQIQNRLKNYEIKQIIDFEINPATENNTVKSFTYILNIKNITDDEEGTYKCVLSNVFGEDEQTFEVKVLDSTHIEEIIATNNEINVVEGSTAYIKCEVKESPISIIQWSKDGVPLLSSDHVFFDSYNVVVVNSLTLSDAGVYTCYGINNIGIVVKNFTLLVIEPPTSIMDKEILQTSVAGDTVILPCQIIALTPPKITWMLNGRNLDTDDPKYNKTDSSLSFQANSGDTGIYECRAINDAGNVTLGTVLIVYAAPTIYPAEDEIVKVTSKSDIVLKCEAYGYPMPDVSWRYDGKLIENSTDKEITENGNLILSNVTTENDGAYVCDAFNGIGLTQKVYYIVTYDAPKIISDFPKNKTYFEDEEFSLNIKCEAIGNPHPEIFWTKNGKQIIKIIDNDILEVNKNSTSIAGNYTCQAQNNEGVDYKMISLEFIEKPKIKNSLPISAKQNVLIKENINLPCPIEGGNNIVWLKDNRPINFKLYASFKIKDNILSINSLSSYMGGNYTCVSENDAGKTEFTYEVIPLIPPTDVNANFLKSRGNFDDSDKEIPEIILNSDEKFELSCNANGNPKPEIVWLKNSNVVSRTEIVLIENVHFNDSGIYTCVAKNKYGTSEKSYELIVTAHPSYHFGELEQYFQLNKGEDFDLNCILEGYPTPEIVWFKNGEILNEYQELLEFRNIDLDDAGLYKCIGGNKLGDVEILFHVDLFDKPTITDIGKDTSVITNNPLNLTCSSKGQPLPILSWLFNGRVQSTTARVHFDNEFQNQLNNLETIYVDPFGNGFSLNSLFNNNKSDRLKQMNSYGIVKYETMNNETIISLDLIIPNIKKEKSGKYTCVSYNSIGKDDKQVMVKVLTPPKLINPTIPEVQDIDIIEGLPVILTCPIVGHPVPTIEWFKDDSFLDNNRNTKTDNSNKYLTLIQTTSQDAGMYKCLAKNIAGETKLYFNVTILVPPTLIPTFTDTNDIQDIDDSLSEYINVNYGENLILNCPVTGNPKPKIYWSKVDMESPKGNYLLAINSSLYIQSIKKPESFMCTGNSTIGTIQKIYHINVQAPPDMENMKDEQISTKIYHAFTLECKINGSPEPNITWHKDGKILERFETEDENIVNLFISSDGTTLKIISPTKADSGRYVCVATNDLGSVHKIFNVEIDVPVEWSPWGSWSSCSKTCGKGIRSRKRVCLLPNGFPAEGIDSKCIGQNSQIQGCEIAHCPINGGWGEWSFWTECSSNCVSIDRETDSVRRRYRKCDSPLPELGGMPCIGADTQQEECAVPYCPIDGDWSDWSNWSTCSVTCGSGFNNRKRTCTNPIPRHGGQPCQGNEVEVKLCNSVNCPVHGDWSSWSPWSKCSNTCGSGYKQRKRSCNNPEPNFGGDICVGDNVEFQTCKFKPCINSEPMRNQPNPKRTYTPYMSFDVMPFEKSSDETLNSNSNYLFSESAPVKYVQPPLFNNTVVVTLESKNRLSDEIVEMYIPIPARLQNDQSYKKKCEKGYKLNLKTQECSDINECEDRNICDPTSVCINTLGSFKCNCKTGFMKSETNDECIDLNECMLKTHQCSHNCENLSGSYKCSCPSNYILDSSNRKCIIKNYRHQRDKPTLMYLSKDFSKFSEMVCPDGYHVENQKCVDSDECLTMEDKCGFEQTCLNTKGSYLCVPTPCPEDYVRDENSGQCLQMCKDQHNGECTDGAVIAQSISYTILSLTQLDFDLPFLKLQIPIGIPNERTTFSFIERSNRDIFNMENIEKKNGVVYLYANNKFKKDKIYKLKIIAHSYDAEATSLLYITKFIIYVTLH